MLQDRKTSSGEDSTAVPAAEQCGSSRLACSIPWLVAHRARLGHSRPACTTKNAPNLAGGVEEDTLATDCQTHQEYTSSLCGLHRCNRWTYAILTDFWGFIGDPRDLPDNFSHSHLVLRTDNEWIFFCKWNDVIKYINFRYVLVSFYFTIHTNIPYFFYYV